ncbi:MAG: YggS family pyridoxal phosphate-dependent enzyme [Christensenellaceae bacterium]
MLRENLDLFLDICKNKNPFGEEVTLVGATKTVGADVINQAIALGLKDVGENYPQEFRDKFPQVLPVNYHFFGRLQKNKVKYLIGKACLIQSVDGFDLAQEISRQSVNKAVETKILIEVNLGEENKGGIPLENVVSEYAKIRNLPNLKINGLMAIMPNVDDFQIIRKLCLHVRGTYDIIREKDENFTTLSMGMSNDYEVAIECGSNMIRIGSKIFGERIYKEKA